MSLIGSISNNESIEMIFNRDWRHQWGNQKPKSDGQAETEKAKGETMVDKALHRIQHEPRYQI